MKKRKEGENSRKSIIELFVWNSCELGWVRMYIQSYSTDSELRSDGGMTIQRWSWNYRITRRSTSTAILSTAKPTEFNCDPPFRRTFHPDVATDNFRCYKPSNKSRVPFIWHVERYVQYRFDHQ